VVKQLGCRSRGAGAGVTSRSEAIRRAGCIHRPIIRSSTEAENGYGRNRAWGVGPTPHEGPRRSRYEVLRTGRRAGASYK